MSPRVRAVGSMTVYAGTASQLAQKAEGYAEGRDDRPRGYHPDLFYRAAAAELRSGVRVIDLGAVRFYADRGNGAPFHGPFAPDPDPEWVARRAAAGLSAGA